MCSSTDIFACTLFFQLKTSYLRYYLDSCSKARNNRLLHSLLPRKTSSNRLTLYWLLPSNPISPASSCASNFAHLLVYKGYIQKYREKLYSVRKYLIILSTTFFGNQLTLYGHYVINHFWQTTSQKLLATRLL